MFHYVDAGVANAAMRATRRSVKLARRTPFHSHIYVIYLHVFVRGRLIVADYFTILFEAVANVHFGKAARIHEGRYQKV